MAGCIKSGKLLTGMQGLGRTTIVTVKMIIHGYYVRFVFVCVNKVRLYKFKWLAWAPKLCLKAFRYNSWYPSIIITALTRWQVISSCFETVAPSAVHRSPITQELYSDGSESLDNWIWIRKDSHSLKISHRKHSIVTHCRRRSSREFKASGGNINRCLLLVTGLRE